MMNGYGIVTSNYSISNLGYHDNDLDTQLTHKMDKNKSEFKDTAIFVHQQCKSLHPSSRSDFMQRTYPNSITMLNHADQRKDPDSSVRTVVKPSSKFTEHDNARQALNRQAIFEFTRDESSRTRNKMEELKAKGRISLCKDVLQNWGST